MFLGISIASFCLLIAAGIYVAPFYKNKQTRQLINKVEGATPEDVEKMVRSLTK